MNPRQLKGQPQPALLYRIVFRSRAVLLVSLVLVLTFALQPIIRAEAAEIDLDVVNDLEMVTQAPEEPVDTEIPLPPLIPEATPEPLPDNALPLPESPVEDGVAVIPEESSLPSPVVVGALASSAPVTVDSTETASSSDSTEEMTDTASATTTAVSESGATTSPDEVTESVDIVADESGAGETATDTPATPQSEEVATTTMVNATETLPLIHETYSDAEVRFLKRDCVTVAGGAYYCQARAPGGSTKDALIAEPDSGGDLEIFLVKEGDYHQLTFNDVDDAAPFYDGRSETMVWHRLVGDAYVIYEYDFTSGEERALSRGHHNDMEPTRFGDRTVWQRWADDHWQVILHNDDEEIQLTTAAAHHVAPVIRGDIILWQTIDTSGEKQIETFDLLTGAYNTINDSESAALANPRMMMVYEAVYDNGDVVTRGVDLKTGEVMALDALPAELPEEIPESESTGETRALLTPKPTQKEGESEVDGEPVPSVPPNASTTDPLTLDLRPADVATSTVPGVASSSPLFAPEDLLIEPLSVIDGAASSTAE